MRAIARALLGERRFDRALDVGCGSGGNLALLAEHAVEVVALDREPSALRFAREAGPAGLALADAAALPFAAASFDLVWLWNVVEHVEDDAAALSEAARVLSPGGLAVVSTSASMLLWSDHDVANHHFRRYSGRGLRRAVERAGLRATRVTHANAGLFAPVAAVAAGHRLRARLFGRPRYEKNAVEVPAVVDSLLRAMLEAEARWLTRRDLPIGVSLFALCEKG